MTTAEAERSAVVLFLRGTADYWRKDSDRLWRNPDAASIQRIKADLLEAVAKDIEDGRHLP